MKTRIEINGVWYVKEDTTNTQPETPKFDAALATHFEGYVYETTDYCWEATRIYKDKEFYNGVSIKFTNKKTKEVEYWDNERWMKEVLHNDKNALREARTSMNDNGIATFKLFISFLMYHKWLK